jgi:hypothetical protein
MGNCIDRHRYCWLEFECHYWWRCILSIIFSKRFVVLCLVVIIVIHLLIVTDDDKMVERENVDEIVHDVNDEDEACNMTLTYLLSINYLSVVLDGVLNLKDVKEYDEEEACNCLDCLDCLFV